MCKENFVSVIKIRNTRNIQFFEKKKLLNSQLNVKYKYIKTLSLLFMYIFLIGNDERQNGLSHIPKMFSLSYLIIGHKTMQIFIFVNDNAFQPQEKVTWVMSSVLETNECILIGI